MHAVTDLMLSSPEIGELDLHLFNEGTHRQLWRMLGPQAVPAPQGPGYQVRIAVWAPAAQRVHVIGDWNHWQPTELHNLGSSGIWSAVVPGRSGDYYKLQITGADGQCVTKADPMARATELPPGDASRIPEFGAYTWNDSAWIGSRGAVVAGTAPLRIYEVHAPSWREGIGDWDSLALHLGEHVRDLGFTHVELLPIAEHPFGGSWGYQISGFYAPTARLGDPGGLKRFVDHLHGLGIGVILDWVPAHFVRDAWALGRFDGTALYEHQDPRRGEHPDWGTYVFNLGRIEVRNFLIANALYWVEEFHVDALRVDAVASMLYLDYSRAEGEWIPNRHGGREDLEAISFLRELNTVMGQTHPDVAMIAEESTAWPGVTRPAAQGGLGFSHKWNLGWMHDTLEYFGRDPVHRRHHHGDLSFTMLYAHHERFLLPLSHDEVVHGKGSLLAKMAGDDWQKFANLRALLAWQWIMPGPPLVFMGTEIAPWEEWTERHGLPWHLLEHGPHRGVRDVIITLNEVAAAWPAIWRRDLDPAGFQWLEADDAQNSVYSFVRWDDNGAAAVACVANLTPVPRPAYRVGLPWAGQWQVLLDTDRPAFGGSGYRGNASDIVSPDQDQPWHGQGHSVVVDLAPLSVLWLGSASPDLPVREPETQC
jgi:1,4-alpha-glucan branching enzyme